MPVSGAEKFTYVYFLASLHNIAKIPIIRFNVKVSEKGMNMEISQRQLSAMLETAIVAARLAGQRAMEELKYIKTSIKHEDEIVTQADTLCQQIIIDRIKENYPDHGFIAEETDNGSIFRQPPRGSDKFWWVIDPIDGTNNFANRILCFTVSIAVMYDGCPIVGVIFDPATDSMFATVKGSDAQLNGRKITAGDTDIGRFASVAIDSHYEADIPAWAKYIMKKTRFRNLGSTALHLAYVAKGSMIASIINRAKIWDIAAGVLIAQNAGAIVTKYKGEKIFPIDFDNCELELFEMVTANKKAHPKIIALLNE